MYIAILCTYSTNTVITLGSSLPNLELDSRELLKLVAEVRDIASHAVHRIHETCCVLNAEFVQHFQQRAVVVADAFLGVLQQLPGTRSTGCTW